MTQALGACGRQALRRAAVGMAPTWCGLKRPQEERGCCPGSGLWVRRARPHVHLGNTLRAVGDRSLRWGCCVLMAAQSLGSGHHTHPSQKFTANRTVQRISCRVITLYPRVGVGHIPVMSSEMRPNLQSLLRLTRCHFKRTIYTAVCTVSVAQPVAGGFPGSPPPGRTPCASKASPPSSPPTLGWAHLPLQVSALSSPGRASPGLFPGPGCG